MPKRSDQQHDDPAMGSVDPQRHPPQPFPDADWAWFLARAAALGIAAADGRRAVLEALFGHLVGVNRWLNLTTLTTPREFLKLHVLDSLALECDARSRHLSEGSPCVDLGSGGGYPGLPLALWHPAIPWVLIDARRKKAEFLQAACAVAVRMGGAKVRAQHLRGGDAARGAPELRRRCQLVVCRAMGQAADVLGESADLLHKSGHLVVYKGPAFAGPERDAALAACARLGLRHVSDRDVVLEEGDPARVLAVFQRVT
jgi:16S rRNA (guanine527-N7)-methyltransferase